MRVMGVDPGLTRCGVGVVDGVAGRTLTLVDVVVVRTPPGGAQYLASHIDHTVLPGVIGTVAGDDTVLLVTRSATGGLEVAERLLELINGRARLA